MRKAQLVDSLIVGTPNLRGARSDVTPACVLVLPFIGFVSTFI
jgi:hypothetical protein